MILKTVKSAIWPVTAYVQADGGEKNEHEFFARFKKLKDSEHEAWSKAFAEENGYLPTEKDLLNHVVEGLGETLTEVEANAEALAEMLDEPCYQVALYQQYQNFRVGISVKN